MYSSHITLSKGPIMTSQSTNIEDSLTSLTSLCDDFFNSDFDTYQNAATQLIHFYMNDVFCKEDYNHITKHPEYHNFDSWLTENRSLAVHTGRSFKMPTDPDAKFVTGFCFLQYLADNEPRKIHLLGQLFGLQGKADAILAAVKNSVVQPWTREAIHKLSKLSTANSSELIIQQTVNNITNNIGGSGKATIKCTTSNTSSGSGTPPSKWQEAWSGLKMFFVALASILHLQYITLAVNAYWRIPWKFPRKKFLEKNLKMRLKILENFFGETPSHVVGSPFI